MPHLHIDTLARLGSDEPSPDERAHLNTCGQCARAVTQFRRQGAALAALPPLAPPAHGWSGIDAALAHRSGATRGTARQRMRIAAAAVVVFAFGNAIGIGAANWHHARAAGSDNPVANDSHRTVAQLAALENILLTTEVAMRDAPQDPLLSRYRASALREREALLTHVRLISNRTWY